MSDNVIPLGNITKLDLPVDTVLDGAKGKLTGCVIIGYDSDEMEYFASTFADGGEVLWLLERAKLQLLRMGDVDD